jgi:hypothetical protein
LDVVADLVFAATMAPSVATQISFETFSNIIDGSLRSSKHKYQGIDPNTGSPNWEVPVASLEDVDNAVDAANRAYKEWRTTSWEYRRERIDLFKETLQAYGQSYLLNERVEQACSSIIFGNSELIFGPQRRIC